MEAQMHEPLAKRLARFVGLLSAIAVVTGVVVVTQRLSRDTLALLVGLTCGVLAMAPTIGLALLVWRREETRQQTAHTNPAMTPPVIVVTPQLPGYGAPALPGSTQPVAWPWQPAPNERVFTVVGGEE
ncbi:MAG TPA: hypothetical protein PKZ84_18980 [Anaerolineae bacterium]|nr:hypothetical protein [Anaerolineae bacterium]HQI86714.1 hypothetical protein [Anaerolineae bacterium]